MITLQPEKNKNNVEQVFTFDQGGGIKDGPVAEKSINRKPTFIPCGLISRQQEEDELGVPTSQSNCFACSYIGEDAATSVAFEEVVKLTDLIRKNVGKKNPVDLCRHIAERYDELRADVNDNLQPGRKSWPEMTAADWLHHLRFHNNDPELQKWFMFEELKEVRQIALHASIVQNEETGAIQTDDKQFKVYLDVIKAQEMLYKSDPTKHLYYSGGKHADPMILSEGPIHLSGKNLHSKFSKRKK